MKINKMVKTALLGAIAGVLMIVEFPIPIFPTFLKMDFSDIPAIIAAIVLGPIYGIIVEFIKVMINFFINGTVTAGVGELANFLIGVSIVLPVGLIFKKYKSYKSTVLGCLASTGSMIVVAGVLNYFVLIPVYAKAFNMKFMDFVNAAKALPVMGQYFNKEIDLILFGIVPFNALKGIALTIFMVLLYKLVIPPLLRIQKESV